MQLKKVMSIFGTRPEAIKMAPLVKWIEADPDLESIVCVTGQHETMLQQVLDQFDITPDHRLNVMTENQTLNGLAARVLESLNHVFDIAQPDRVLVRTLARPKHKLLISHCYVCEGGMVTGYRRG